MTRVSFAALVGVFAFAALASGCMPERLGIATESKPGKAQPSSLEHVLARSTTTPRPTPARAYAEGRSSELAMRNVRTTECIATAITNRTGDGARIDPENVRELIAWAAPLCQQELDALVGAYDRAYGAGLGLTYLRVYLRELPTELEARFKRTARFTS